MLLLRKLLRDASIYERCSQSQLFPHQNLIFVVCGDFLWEFSKAETMYGLIIDQRTDELGSISTARTGELG